MNEIAHLDAVQAVALGDSADLTEISSSWLRSADRFRIDPSNRTAPSILTSTELSVHREPLSRLINVASEEIDSLHKIVGQAGYVVLVCDANGVAVDHRGDPRLADDFKYWGIWLGGVWSEDVEGTNGIGTCIEDKRAITVHLSEHYRSRHTGLSCAGAPIFTPDGSLLAVVDVSAMNPSLSETAHGLTGPLTVRTARCVEERLFRDTYRREWIAAISPGTADPILLAIDDDFRIVGANRKARTTLALDSERLASGVSFWNYFARDHSAFRPRECADLAVELSRIANGEKWQSLLTPPHGRLTDGLALAVHTRPREGLLTSLRSTDSAPPARGGLSARALRQARAFADDHLSESIDVAQLADAAGLSVFHFSRQFKRSLGVTPHRYLVVRRIERARELLETSSMTLAEIAHATGFSDQAHLARQFRRQTGMTPRQYRQTHR